MITPTSFVIRFPEFTAISTARIQMFIDDAVVVLNEAFWGVKYDLGLSYLTAHELALAEKAAAAAIGSGAVSGPITSKSVDGVSVTYAAPSPISGGIQGDSYLSLTGYGQKYLALRRTLGAAAYVI